MKSVALFLNCQPKNWGIVTQKHYSNHVLEHIPNDRKAMKELFRVLKPGGWAIMQVPIDINIDKTLEIPMEMLQKMQPEDRERIFGQKDHVRVYGRDYKDRLEKAGFAVYVDSYVKEIESCMINNALSENEDIYLCMKKT